MTEESQCMLSLNTMKVTSPDSTNTGKLSKLPTAEGLSILL